MVPAQPGWEPGLGTGLGSELAAPCCTIRAARRMQQERGRLHLVKMHGSSSGESTEDNLLDIRAAGPTQAQSHRVTEGRAPPPW